MFVELSQSSISIYSSEELIVITLLLDGVLTNILPYTVNNLSIFTPMFTILLPIIIYPFYIKQEKKYLITLIITGIVYDIFYTISFQD